MVRFIVVVVAARALSLSSYNSRIFDNKENILLNISVYYRLYIYITHCVFYII